MTILNRELARKGLRAETLFSVVMPETYVCLPFIRTDSEERVREMITDRKFTVDDDLCTRCGRCAKVCPVDNIEGTPPAWLHNGRCTCCLACYHHCPVHAINYGDITRKRGQYYMRQP